MPAPGPDSLRAYHEQGYLIVRAAISPKEAASLKDEVLRILAEDAAARASHPGFQQSNRHLRFSLGLHLRSPAILAYVRSAPLRDIALALLGPEAELQYTSTITKTPDKSQEVDWHQDGVYAKDGHEPRLLCWTALVDTNRDNGGLAVLPGSHTHGLVPHAQSPRNELNQVAQTETAAAVPIDLNAGDFLVIHPHLVHGSPENRTAADRVALMSGYQAPKAAYSESEMRLRADLF